MDMNILYALGAALAVYLVFQRLTGVRRTPAGEVLAAIKSGAKVIDVRTPGEFSSGSYRKAKNIPLADLASRLGDLGAKDEAVVVFCASGSRSAQAAKLLRRAGFSRVLNAGGLADMPR